MPALIAPAALLVSARCSLLDYKGYGGSNPIVFRAVPNAFIRGSSLCKDVVETTRAIES